MAKGKKKEVATENIETTVKPTKAKVAKLKKKKLPKESHCKHSNSANIGVIVPNAYLKPINNKFYWHIDENNLSSDMEKFKIIYAFSQAFLKWQPNLNPITFEPTSNINQAQIVIRFMVNGNPDLPEAFDDGVLAYAYAPNLESLDYRADMYLNDEYEWNDILTDDSIVLFNVVVHELGHTLNLGHSNNIKDIMYPYYQPTAEVTITKDTAVGIYNLYKRFGVANPNASGNGGNQSALSLKDLFQIKSDLARLSLRQLNVLAAFLNVTINNNDKTQTIINKIYSKIYS